jgi:4-oxalocrotonate tautomerase
MMPLIQISEAAVRNDEQAASIIRAVTDAYAASSGTTAEKVWVVINPVSRANWGTGGVSLASRDAASAATSAAATQTATPGER